MWRRKWVLHTIEDMPGYFGLQIEYRDDLPANNAGYLDPAEEPQYIAVNRNLPHCEHAFTVAHELGHYVLHVGRKPRNFLPGYLNFAWQSKPLAGSARTTERWLRRYFNQEWQADLYAFCLMFNLGEANDLKAFVERHPGKMWLYFLATTICFVKAIPRIIKGLMLICLKRLGLYHA
jgi:hypothetical protein